MKKNLLTSLKELLEALGGEKSNQTNIVGVVDEITEQIGNKQEEDSEATMKATAFVVHAAGEVTSTPSTITCDKTFAELTEAYNIGRPLFLEHISAAPGVNIVGSPAEISIENNTFAGVKFVSPITSNGIYSYVINSEGITGVVTGG